MFNLTRSFKLAATSALVATLALAVTGPAAADDRRGRDRGDRHGQYDRHDNGRNWDNRGRDHRHHYKSPKVVVRPSVGFSYYQSYPTYYRPHYTPPRTHRYNAWTYNRPYRRHHSGFGFYYSDNDAFRFLGLTALGLFIGNVVVTREGHTTDGRPCREFQQEVMISGKREQAYGTACMQPDGAWKVTN